MITSELISYIRKQIDNNISKDTIISKLTEAGWRTEDIDEAFSTIEQELKPKVVEELIPTLIPKTVKTEIVSQNEEPEEKKELPKVETPNIEEQKKEIPTVEIQKVWTPMSVPIKENIQAENFDSNIKTGENEIVIQNEELQAKDKNIPEKLEPKETENFNKTPNLINLKDINKKEELTPTSIPKVTINSFGSINKNNREDLLKTESISVVSDEKSKDSLIKNLPKTAMLSSYQDDLSSAVKIEENVKKRSHKIMRWIVLVLIILALAAWIFASGHLNFPFVKKDPKILLLNNSKVLSSLKSYKTETNVEISSPSFANIASGLVSGEAITHTDKDSISINTLGIINQNGNGFLSDNFVTIKSSLLQNYITTDIKNDGSELFVSVPDLSEILNENAPEPSMIKINEQQFNLIPPLFSLPTETILTKINLYKILSSGMSSYIDNKTLDVYNAFVNNAEITEKEEESIKGVDTYHYLINTDRQQTKTLLNKISDNFVSNLSSDDKNSLDQILGSVTVESLDVWIGKEDNNIYQYDVILDVPLSKIIGFEDKSIGDSLVSIDWKTTYYDFNVSNNIIMPDVSIGATDFINNIKEKKIKNDVSSFKQLATNLFNIEKTYGKKSNPSGSCMKPISESLFSPTGHIKSATSAIGSISLFLNEILKITNNVGYCYSTTKAWSFTVPISDNYDSTISLPEYKSYLCIDNTGSSVDLTAPPTGVVCFPKAIPTGE